MPFIPHTPEALLPRSDSKNPATTCKGITSNGRPCRRALAASPRSSPGASPAAGHGVLAVLSGVEEDGGAAAFFCWQHKEQAAKLKEGETGARNTTLVSLNKRTSVDTLIDRLGVLDVEDHTGKASKRRQPTDNGSPIQREKMHKQWQNVNGPLLAVPKDTHNNRKTAAKMATETRTGSRRQPRRESNLLLSLFCCVRSDDTDDAPAPRIRHHTKPSPAAPAVSHSPPSNNYLTQPVPSVKLAPLSNRPFLPRDPPSQTQNLLTLIPSYLTPQTTSALLSELAKPISDFDEEGFIYMFWLTDASSATAPNAQTASSLLSSTSTSSIQGRRSSDLLHGFSNATSAQKTILLKIGRASNVQRRMNEWTRQCGYNLSLIRYYPYLPSSPSAPPTPSKLSPSQSRNPPLTPPLIPRKVPHAHRVERLIHIELGNKRVKNLCESCGKEHREWFEVEASRNGVAAVDEVVRRWVGWAEGDK